MTGPRRRKDNAQLQRPADLRALAQPVPFLSSVTTDLESSTIIRLKNEVNALCQQQGETARYPTELNQNLKLAPIDFLSVPPADGLLNPERNQAEAQLRRNHDTFFTLIQNAPFGLYVVDAQFRLRQVSTASQKVFSHIHPLIGRDFDEVLRLVWADPFASEAIGRFRHTLKTGEPYAAPSTSQPRQGSLEVESYDWKIERITLPDGEFGVVCYFYDITERNLVQEALRESEERYRNLFNSIDEGYCIIEMMFDERGKPVDYRFG